MNADRIRIPIWPSTPPCQHSHGEPDGSLDMTPHHTYPSDTCLTPDRIPSGRRSGEPKQGHRTTVETHIPESSRLELQPIETADYIQPWRYSHQTPSPGTGISLPIAHMTRYLAGVGKVQYPLTRSTLQTLSPRISTPVHVRLGLIVQLLVALQTVERILRPLYHTSIYLRL